MANNQTHLVSPELAQNAQFKSIHAIPTNHLQAGDVIQVLPGTYDDPRTSNVADVTIVGMGNAKDVIFTGFSIPTAMAAGANVIIKNCKINTPGAIIGNTASTTTFIDCIFDGTSGNAILPSTAAGVVDNAAVLIGVLDSNAAVAATDAASAARAGATCKASSAKGTAVSSGYPPSGLCYSSTAEPNESTSSDGVFERPTRRFLRTFYR